MQDDELYELVYNATRDAVRDLQGGGEVKLSRRMIAGSVVFRDGDGRTVKETSTEAFFKKVTGVRDKLRVLEAKLNANKSLGFGEKAELQAYITRAYGSLTTFNFLFRDEADKFRGTGG